MVRLYLSWHPPWAIKLVQLDGKVQWEKLVEPLKALEGLKLDFSDEVKYDYDNFMMYV